MDRRLLTVLSLSTALALVVSLVFYQAATRAVRDQARGETRPVVVAAYRLPPGASIGASGVRVARMPVEVVPRGGFSAVNQVVGRPVASAIEADEAVTEARLGPAGGGSGLAPLIPVGMRAVSVKVDEVVGVAGFVVPGMRVDVLTTGRGPAGDDPVTRTILQNIQVLSAGQTIQSDPSGQAIRAPVVTLLVAPEQAESLTLAAHHGRIQLVLRNGADGGVGHPPGRALEQLYGGGPAPPAAPVVRVVARPRVVEPPAAAPAPKALPQVTVIRGNQRTVETVPEAHP